MDKKNSNRCLDCGFFISLLSLKPDIEFTATIGIDPPASNPPFLDGQCGWNGKIISDVRSKRWCRFFEVRRKGWTREQYAQLVKKRLRWYLFIQNLKNMPKSAIVFLSLIILTFTLTIITTFLIDLGLIPPPF